MTAPRLGSLTLSAALYGLALLLLAAATAAHTLLGVPYAKLFSDPTAVAEVHPFTGALSVVGSLMWAASAAICLQAGAVLRARSEHGGLAGYLLAAGLLSAWLLFDDQFLIHEAIAEDRLGVDQRLFFAAYVAAVAFGAVRFRHLVLASRWRLLAVSLALLALSVGIDVLHRPLGVSGEATVFFEDTFKLLGIAGWLGYFGQTSFDALRGEGVTTAAATPLR